MALSVDRSQLFFLPICVRFRRIRCPTSVPRFTTVNVYPHYLEDALLPRILLDFFECTYTERISEADIVISSVFPSYTLKSRLLSKLSPELKPYEYIRKPKGSSQLWIHDSGEVPGFSEYSTFLSSNCDLGIGYEVPVDLQNTKYHHTPIWLNSLDWSTYGIRISSGATVQRLGRLIKPSELTIPLSWSQWSTRTNRIISTASHYPPLRYLALNALQKCMHVDLQGYVPYEFKQSCSIPKSIPKCRAYAKYRYALCIENRLFPNYVTEKIPEAFAHGVIPISYSPGLTTSGFNKGSYIDMSDFICSPLSDPAGLTGISSEYIKAGFILTKDSPQFNIPLLSQPPCLDQLLAFLKLNVPIF